MPAAVALEQLAGTVTNDTVIGYGTTRAMKTRRPARLLDRLGALRLIAEAAQEFGDRDAVLELNLLVDHGALRHAKAPGYELTGSWRETAEAGF